MKDDDLMDFEYPMVDFTANDRCDGCGAQAYCMARHDELGELLFCIHHRRENYELLFSTGWEIVDNMEGLMQLAEAEGIPF